MCVAAAHVSLTAVRLDAEERTGAVGTLRPKVVSEPARCPCRPCRRCTTRRSLCCLVPSRTRPSSATPSISSLATLPPRTAPAQRYAPSRPHAFDWRTGLTLPHPRRRRPGRARTYPDTVDTYIRRPARKAVRARTPQTLRSAQLLHHSPPCQASVAYGTSAPRCPSLSASYLRGS